MRAVKSIFSVALLAVIASSCSNMDYKKTRGGVPYKIFSSSGKGDSIHQNNIVKFQVVQKVKDSVLFNSYNDGMAQYLQVMPVSGQVSYNDMGLNLTDMLTKCKKGDSIYFVQSIDSLTKGNPEMLKQSKLKKGDEITTGIRVVDIYKTSAEANAAVMKDKLASAGKMEQEGLTRFKSDTAAQAQMAKDSRIIEDYLKANNIQAQKTQWGVYIQTLAPGQGPKPATGQYANVKYKGTDFKGVVFDSGVYPLQVGVGGSIKGFEEGVKQLSKGGRAKVFIPSMLGYGPRGSAPKIEPNQNLIFDLELLDVSDNPPAQVPNPAGGADTTGGH